MTPPIVPEEPPAILRDEELKAILDACAGADFDARRDTAIIRLLLDTGMRRAELAGLKLDDIDMDQQVAIVMGKGRRPRACPFGNKTAQALDRYLRLRPGAPSRRADPELWLAPRGVSPTAACCRCCGAAAPRPDCRSSTPTSSATRTPTCGSPTAATRAT